MTTRAPSRPPNACLAVDPAIGNVRQDVSSPAPRMPQRSIVVYRFIFLLPNDKPQGRGASPRPAGGACSRILSLRYFALGTGIQLDFVSPFSYLIFKVVISVWDGIENPTQPPADSPRDTVLFEIS